MCEYNCTVLLAIAQHVVDNHVVETHPVTLPQSSHIDERHSVQLAENKIEAEHFPSSLISVQNEPQAQLMEEEDSLHSTVQFVYCQPIESSSESQTAERDILQRTSTEESHEIKGASFGNDHQNSEKLQPLQSNVMESASCAIKEDSTSVKSSRTSVIVSCDESVGEPSSTAGGVDTVPKSIDGDSQLPLNKRGRPRLQFSPQEKKGSPEPSGGQVRTRRQVAEKQAQGKMEVEITGVVPKRRRGRRQNQTDVKAEPGIDKPAARKTTLQLRNSENANRQNAGVKEGNKTLDIQGGAQSGEMSAGGDHSNNGMEGDAGNSEPADCDGTGDLHCNLQCRSPVPTQSTGSPGQCEDKVGEDTYTEHTEEKPRKRKAKVETSDGGSDTKMLRGDREDLKARTCPFCETVMEHISEVLPHYKKEHDYEPKAYKCDFNRAAKELNELNEVPNKNTIKTMDNIDMCHICGKHLLKENLLKHIILKHVWRRHNQRISRAKPTMCHICGRVLHHTQNMDRHMKEHMGQVVKKRKEASFMCDICGYTTPESSRLKYHYQARHSGQMPFKCKECEYQTWEKSSFSCHMYRHQNEKKFKCSECPYQCIQKKQLRNHLTRHHGITMLKMYKWVVTESGKVKLKRLDPEEAEAKADEPPESSGGSSALVSALTSAPSVQPEYTVPQYPPTGVDEKNLMPLGPPVCVEPVVETPQPTQSTILVDEGLYHPAVSVPMAEVSAAVPQQTVLHYLPQQVLRTPSYQTSPGETLLYSDLTHATPQRMAVSLPTDSMPTLVQLAPSEMPLNSSEHTVEGGLEQDIAQALIQIHPTPPHSMAQHTDYLLATDPHTIHHPAPL